MIETIVILGAGGDLAGRLVLPAVAALIEAGDIGPNLHVVGADARDWSEGEFAAHACERLSAHAQHVSPSARDALVTSLRYRRADVSAAVDVADVCGLARSVAEGPIAVYLALPTQLMLTAVRNVLAADLPRGSRIAVEKPFGDDLASAVDLNAALAAALDADAVYRVDHFLAMTAVQELPTSVGRSNGGIEQLDLLFEETLALEGRASFYDRAGALRDVMQNHLVQVLCTIAATHAGPAGRAEVLRSVRPLTAADVVATSCRARYTAGRLAGTGGADGRTVPDYVEEPGVDPARGTETFAEVNLGLDAPGWSGTRFVLRAGKALAARRRGVLIRPGTATHGPVWLDLDAPSSAEPGGAEPFAYRRIVADLLSGGSAFAVGAEEAELAWRVFTPVLESWESEAVPLLDYPAGSAGPIDVADTFRT